MSEVAKRLQERRQNVWEQAKALADRAAEEERNFSGEEERQWRELDSELDALDKRIQDILSGEKRAKEAEDAMAAIAGKPAQRGGQQPGNDPEADELRKFLRGESRVYELAMPSVIERRSLVTTGAPMPTGFVGQLYSYMVDTNSVRQAGATIISTSSGEQILVPKSTAEGAAVWTAEAAALTASDPTLSSATLGAYKVGKIIQLSTELSIDEGFDIIGFLAQSAGRNIGIATNTAYVAGTGTTQPTGFVGAAAVALTAATGTGSTTGFPTSGASIGADVLIDLVYSVLSQYRTRGAFMAHDATVKAARKLKDTTGQYLWQPSLQLGQPDSLLGYPVYSNPAMDQFGAGKKPIAFGDFSAYYIRDVSPIRFERSDEYAFGSDMVSFRALFRTDGVLIDPNAVKVYQTAAS